MIDREYALKGIVGSQILEDERAEEANHQNSADHLAVVPATPVTSHRTYRSHRGLTTAILGAGGVLLALIASDNGVVEGVTRILAQEAQPAETYPVFENTIWGPVTAQVRVDYTYADRLPAGDLRIGGGVTLDDPSEVERFLQDNQDFLFRKAGGNQRLFQRLDAVSAVIRNNLADMGFNVDVLKADDVLMGQQVPLSDVPQTIISIFPELKDQILAEFSKKGMEVVPQTVTSFDEQGNATETTEYELTRGVVPQVIANPNNLAQKMFIFAKVVPPELHDLNKFQFGTHEGYWILAQRQQMEDGRIRTLITFLRNDCVNTVEVAIMTEEFPATPTPTPIPPTVPPGETPPPTNTPVLPTNTPVPEVPTPPAPPVLHEVPSIPTATPVPPTEVPTPTPAPTNIEVPFPTATPPVPPTPTPAPTNTEVPFPTATVTVPTPTPAPTNIEVPFPTATPRPGETPPPTKTPVPPTNTPPPSPTPAPTNTEVPFPTATPRPTDTPVPPTSTPRPTSTPPPSPTPAPTNTHVPMPTATRSVPPSPTPVR